MTMRLDYPLYVLAVVFFVVAAVSFAVVEDVAARPLYAASTVVVGLLFIGVGYLLRPKVKAAVAAPQQPPPSSAPPVPPQAPVVEAPVAIVSKNVTPLMETPVAETRIVEAAPAVTETAQAAQISAPAAEVPTKETAKGTELTRIRGINEKRADQLRTNGIKSVEDLANASAADLAAKLVVSEKIVKMWIGSAKKLVK